MVAVFINLTIKKTATMVAVFLNLTIKRLISGN